MPAVRFFHIFLGRQSTLKLPGKLSIKSRFANNMANLHSSKLIGFYFQQVLRVVEVQMPEHNGFILFELIQPGLYQVHTLDAIDIGLEDKRTHNLFWSAATTIMPEGFGD